MKTYILPIIFFTTMLLQSCYYDNASELFPVATSNCDTTGVITYGEDIKPLLNGYCGAQNSCHNSNSTSGVYLESYQQVSILDTNRFIGSIDHSSGYSPMPKNGGKLSDCRIELIKKWLRTGKSQ